MSSRLAILLETSWNVLGGRKRYWTSMTLTWHTSTFLPPALLPCFRNPLDVSRDVQSKLTCHRQSVQSFPASHPYTRRTLPLRHMQTGYAYLS